MRLLSTGIGGIAALWLVPVWLGSLAASSPAAEDELRFQSARKIDLPAITREELVAVPLDAAVYAVTNEALSDLQILDKEGHVVPYLLRPQVQTKLTRTVRTTRAQDVTLKLPEDGTLELRFSTGDRYDGPNPNGLTLSIPLRDFEFRMQVFDGADETRLLAETVIFDYSRYMDLRETSIRLPGDGTTRFLVRIDSPTSQQKSELKELTHQFLDGKGERIEERQSVVDRSLRIDRVMIWAETEREDPDGDATVDYPVRSFEVTQNPEQKETIVTIEVNREPITSLTLESSARNFHRMAVVDVYRPPRNEWARVGMGSLSRFTFQGKGKEEMTLPVQSDRQNRYRIEIADRDNGSLPITGVRARGRVHELVFIADPANLYELHFGADRISAPDYDVVSIHQALATGATPLPGKTGPIVASSAPIEAPPKTFKELLNDPVILGAVIVVLVALLGFGLYSAGRRVPDMEDEEAGAQSR